MLAFLYRTAPGRLLLRVLASRTVSRLCGRFLDSRLSGFLIAPFARRNGIRTEDYELGGVVTFNQFFRRRIRDGLRPFDADPSHLPAPCDGLLSVHEVQGGTVLPVKQGAYTLRSLLCDDAIASSFEGGTCLVFRLCVDNYHRYCYVDSGAKGPNVFIPGVLHTVRPVALCERAVFAENCREYTVIESARFGTLVQMEVGAMLVGRIVNHEGKGVAVRGKEKGWFEYGGSTVIVLLQAGRACVRADIAARCRAGEEVPVLMGECVATVIESARGSS